MPQKKVTASEANELAEIALDYHRWQGGLSTFVVVRDDGSVKLTSYDRRGLTISEHQEGVLATSGVTELFTTVRKPIVRRALKSRKRYVADWGDADLFYLTLRTKSGELTHWFSMGERAPRAIFFLVAKMLALNSKLKNISPGNFDRYLRAERLTPEDTRNVLEKVRPLEITQFSSALRAVVGRAVGHPREFFLLTAEQAGELQKSRTSMLRHATSVYTLQLFESLFVQPVNPPIIKPRIEASQSTQMASPGNFAAVNKSSSQEKMGAPEAKEPAEIALDYHPSPGDPATFLVLREDGSLKLVRYDRRQLDVWEHQEGVLAAADVAELFKTIRKPTVRRALRPQKSHTRERGDADFFYLTLRAAAGEHGRWFSAAERAPRAVFLLVEKLLALNNKFKRVTSGSFDRYLRVDNLSAQDTKAVLKKVRPAEIGEFPSSVREVMGRAVSHPKEFFLITVEQAGELERARKPILEHARSLYELQLFDSLLVPQGKPVIIKEPPNEDPYESLSSIRPPSRFDRPQ